MGLYELGLQQRKSNFKLVLTLIGVVAIVGSCVKSAYALEQDKLLHATTSACVYGTVFCVVNAKNHENPDHLLPLLITAGLGCFKEFVLDAKADSGDVLANTGGTLCAYGMLSLTW